MYQLVSSFAKTLISKKPGTLSWSFEFELPQKHIDLRERHYRRPACQRALAVMA